MLFTRSKGEGRRRHFSSPRLRPPFLFSLLPFAPPRVTVSETVGSREERRGIVGANTNKAKDDAGRIARRTAFSRSRAAYDRKYRRFPARRPARKVGIFRNYRGRERSTESTSRLPPPQPEADEGNLGGEEETWYRRKSGTLYYVRTRCTFRRIVSGDVSRQFLTIGLRSSPFDSRLSPLSLRTLKRFGQVVAR